MKIIVKYFASLREQTGQSQLQLEFEKPVKLSALKQQLKAEVSLPENILIAVNMDYVRDENTILQDGDEVAFFPPVTGG